MILQYSRNVSQTRWIIDDERMGEASVEVIFSPGNFLFCYDLTCHFGKVESLIL